MKVLVFGYSDNSDRYSFLLAEQLIEHNHETIKFNPRINNSEVLDTKFETVTMYVSKAVSDKFQDFLLSLDFDRIIFNPGSENEQLEIKLKALGVEVIHGCTLVMLRTSQF